MSNTISNAITMRLDEPDTPTAYSVATDIEVHANTVYAIRDGRGGRIETINAILDQLGLVVVPAEIVNTKKAIEMGYMEEDQ